MTTATSTSHEWTRATRKNPCPVCSGTDNCEWTATYCFCGRVSEGSIPDRENSGGQFLHRLNDRFESTTFNRTRTHTHKRPPKKQTAKPKAQTATSDILRMNDPNNITHPESAQSRDIRERLSESIGVSVRSLEKIGVHYRNRDTVGIPERDFEGNVIGISTRSLSTGEKRFAPGGRRGLTHAVNWSHDRWEGTGPIFVVEGASDVAAGLDLEISVVGRPSNVMDADVGALVAISCDSTDREIIILGERDEKPDGQFPGRDGAQAVAKKLSRQLPSDAKIVVAIPPTGCKDLRSFRNKATAEECESGAAAERFLSHLEIIDWERQDSLCDHQPDSKSKSKVDEWAEGTSLESKQSQRGHDPRCRCDRCEIDLERELIDRRQSCTFRRAITNGSEILRLKLDCGTWSCGSCRKKRQSEWSKHFSAIIGRAVPEPEFARHYEKLKTPETIYRFTIDDHSADSKSRELSRVTTWIRRNKGNFIRLGLTSGKTVFYASVLPPKIQAESLNPLSASLQFAEDIRNDLIRERRPVFTSKGWQRPKAKTHDSSEWRAVGGNWNSLESIIRTGEEFDLPVIRPATIGHQKSDIDLKIILPAVHHDIDGFIEAFAERVTENAELRRNKEFASSDEWENSLECRRNPKERASYRTATTNDEFDPWTRPPDHWSDLGS